MLNIKSDSQLVVHQFTEIYEIKEPTLKKYFAEVKKCSVKFHKVQVEQIQREANEEADYQARMASENSEEGLFHLAPILELNKPSYEDEDQIQATTTIENIEQE